MTREIKFRAWDKNEKLMHDVIVFQRGEFIAVPEIGGDGWELKKRKLSDVEIMQYTGLKDKNGKEIYEGDIVNAVSAGSRCNGVITWGVAGFFIKIPPPQSIWYLTTNSENIDEHCEIIGNIYENPELLK